MATATSTTSKATSTTSKATSKATTATAYPVAALPATGTQYRHTSGASGTAAHTAYVQACRTLAAWAGTGANKPLVHALVHLGWCAGSGGRAVCKASNSAAYRHAAPVLHVGQAAAPQVCATLAALAAAGAPAGATSTVWAVYTGAPLPA